MRRGRQMVVPGLVMVGAACLVMGGCGAKVSVTSRAIERAEIAVPPWARRAGGDGDEWALGVAVLSDSSIFVTGYFSGSAIFGQGEINETTLISAGSNDIFLARYSP